MDIEVQGSKDAESTSRFARAESIARSSCGTDAAPRAAGMNFGAGDVNPTTSCIGGQRGRRSAPSTSQVPTFSRAVDPGFVARLPRLRNRAPGRSLCPFWSRTK